MIGTKLGPYEIMEQVGKGGMAVVYRAHQPSMDRSVALKVMTQPVASDPQAVQRFQREARLIARLEHPHILPVYDFDGGCTPPYIVMRYLDGGTLRDALRRGPLSLSDTCFVMRQVSSALDYAHRQGIVHRDIKPSNILIDQDGNAFLSDFGIARLLALGESLTQSGALMGTPEYMAPEQIQGLADMDHRLDIYALGATLFEMLTGQKPFAVEEKPGSSLAALLMHLQSPVPSVLACNPSLPVDVDNVLQRAMAKERSERYDSATALADGLMDALGEALPGPRTGHTGARSYSSILGQREAQSLPTVRDVYTPSNSEQNKTVTALYINAAEYGEIVGLAGGSEAAHQALGEFWQVVGRMIETHQGRVVTCSEHELLAVWGAETAREENAEQAIRSALAMRALFDVASHLPGELSLARWLADGETPPLQMGLNSGLALVAPGKKVDEYTVSGTTISLAYRLMQQAEGSILISHNTYNQVRGVFDVEPDAPLRMRGSQDMVPVYRVMAAKARSFRTAVRGVEGVETRMAGREAELKALQNAFMDALEDGETQAVTLVGEAGIGKSRLLYELDQWAELRRESFWLLRGRAIPEMAGQPYALLREVLSMRFSIYDNDPSPVVRQKLEAGMLAQLDQVAAPSLDLDAQAVTEMAHLLGRLAGFDLADSPFVAPLLADPVQLANRARLLFGRWIALLCASSPAVIELEDIHLADSASLDLFSGLIRDYERLPLLLVCTARPELYERRPTWGGGLPYHTRLDLRRLDRRACRELAREVLKKVTELPRSLRDLLVERSEGNPYYLEELVKMLIDNRAIIRECSPANGEETWRVEEDRLGRQETPASLVALLQARLDSLLYPERLTLLRAAVVGSVFYDRALAAIDAVDETHLHDLSGILERLARAEFIQAREASTFEGSIEYVFRSQMLREALLSMLVRRQVQAYNQACAEWLVQVGAGRLDEYYALVARYYDQAGEARSAAAYWQRAAEKSLALGAVAEARKQFERALELARQVEARDRPELRLWLGKTAYYQGDYAAAHSHLSAGLQAARAGGQVLPTSEALYWLSQAAVREGAYQQARAYVEEGLPLARQAGDTAVLARLLYALGDLHWRLADFEPAQRYCTESLALARQCGDFWQVLNVLNRLAGVAISQGRLDQAEAMLHDVYTQALQAGNRERAATALNNLGAIAEQRGDTAAGQVYLRQALDLVRESGQQYLLATLLINQADGEIELGDFAAARQDLCEGLALARRIGAIPTLLSAVRNAGHMLALEGQVARGLALLGLAFYHAGAVSDSRRLVREILPLLGLDPADPQVQAGLEEGKHLDLEVVVTGLLAQLSQRAE